MDARNIDPFLLLVKEKFHKLDSLEPVILKISWGRIWLNIPLAPPPLDWQRRFPQRKRVIWRDGSDLGWLWSFLVAKRSLLWTGALVWIEYRAGNSVLHIGDKIGCAITVEKTKIPDIVRLSFMFNQCRIEDLCPERT